jgi:elongator complex protein 4
VTDLGPRFRLSKKLIHVFRRSITHHIIDIMPSFTRRVPSTAPPPLPTLIKTGVPSLDDLLHLPPSSTTLIFSPDVHSSWPRLISRYFTAQAFLGSETVSVTGEAGGSRDLVKGCMWVDERSSANTSANTKGEESGSEGEMDVEADNRSKIAWRYGGMEKFKTSIGRSNVCLGRPPHIHTDS